MTCMPVSLIIEVFQRNHFRVVVRPAVEVYDKYGILVQNGDGNQSASNRHDTQVWGEVSDTVQPSSDTVKAPSNSEKAPSNGKKALSKTAVEVIRMLNQDSPTQKYRLTEKGRASLEGLKHDSMTTSILSKLFETHRLVFWYDAEEVSWGCF